MVLLLMRNVLSFVKLHSSQYQSIPIYRVLTRLNMLFGRIITGFIWFQRRETYDYPHYLPYYRPSRPQWSPPVHVPSCGI